jgi:aryl carrier-like protein
MAEDPELENLRRNQVYRDEFLEPPRDDLLSVDPLQKHRDDLLAAGIDSAQRLATTPDWRLAEYLEIDGLVAKRLVAIGQLAHAVPSQLSSFRAEIVGALLAEGIDSVADLTERLQATNPAALAYDLRNIIKKRCRTAPSSRQLEAWFASAKGP